VRPAVLGRLGVVEWLVAVLGRFGVVWLVAVFGRLDVVVRPVVPAWLVVDGRLLVVLREGEALWDCVLCD
jgi:hypothetical protein